MGRKIFGNAGFIRVSDSRKLFLGNGIWDAGMTAFDGFCLCETGRGFDGQGMCGEKAPDETNDCEAAGCVKGVLEKKRCYRLGAGDK